jgi:hypothetical protein
MMDIFHRSPGKFMGANVEIKDILDYYSFVKEKYNIDNINVYSAAPRAVFPFLSMRF